MTPTPLIRENAADASCLLKEVVEDEKICLREHGAEHPCLSGPARRLMSKPTLFDEYLIVWAGFTAILV